MTKQLAPVCIISTQGHTRVSNMVMLAHRKGMNPFVFPTLNNSSSKTGRQPGSSPFVTNSNVSLTRQLHSPETRGFVLEALDYWI